jgi:hypothetical protein
MRGNITARTDAKTPVAPLMPQNHAAYIADALMELANMGTIIDFLRDL